MIKIFRIAQYLIEIVLLPVLFLIAILGRFSKKAIDVGLGPEPLINNIYHKQALELYGYTAQTFVSDVYFITDKFDVRGDKIFRNKSRFLKFVIYLYLWVITVFRYKCLYIYFNGGALSFGTVFLWRVEPLIYKLAGVKVVVMPYGGDVQDMTRSPNLLFKGAMAHDYPEHRLRRQRVASKIDLWTKYADHIIAGCEWVDYLYHWDTIMLAHFSIDMDVWKSNDSSKQLQPGRNSTLKILHAPNHRLIKGTHYFIKAINELVEEGLDIELVLLEKVPNNEVKRVMASVDIVADQLVIGWYAMFALEAMAMSKPVLCYLRDDLKDLYVLSGLVAPQEIPIINCSPLTVKETIRRLAMHREELSEIGQRSREYVFKHHSLEAVGAVFDRINNSLGLKPQRKIH